jgi:hypothetical protein
MRQEFLILDSAKREYLPRSEPALLALLGRRAVIALHAEQEDLALRRRALGRCHAVEIGVAEDASARALKEALGPDATLIDGDHGYESCKNDFLSWSKFVVPGGIVAFHDGHLFPGVWTREDWGSVRVVNELVRSAPSAWEIVEEVDSLVIAQSSSERVEEKPRP